MKYQVQPKQITFRQPESFPCGHLFLAEDPFQSWTFGVFFNLFRSKMMHEQGIFQIWIWVCEGKKFKYWGCYFWTLLHKVCESQKVKILFLVRCWTGVIHFFIFQNLYTVQFFGGAKFGYKFKIVEKHELYVWWSDRFQVTDNLGAFLKNKNKKKRIEICPLCMHISWMRFGCKHFGRCTSPRHGANFQNDATLSWWLSRAPTMQRQRKDCSTTTSQQYWESRAATWHAEQPQWKPSLSRIVVHHRGTRPLAPSHWQETFLRARSQHAK